MNIIIVYVDTSNPFSQYKKLLPFVSKERQEKILRFHFDKDKIISLFTELLIRNEISKQLDISYPDIMFGYNEYGKPYLLNSLDYHFSVSHSCNCIAFVDNTVPIGIDVEKISDPNLKIAERFFTANEAAFVKNNKDPVAAFYRIWTSKEAYVKMLGMGLNKPFKSFDLLNDLLGKVLVKGKNDDCRHRKCTTERVDNRLNQQISSCHFVTERLPDFMLTVCAENIQSDTVNITVIEQKQLMIDVTN